jgi:hypothetical protein
MLSRRELITAGVAGGLHPTLSASAEAAVAPQPAQSQRDQENIQQVSRSLDRVADDLHQALVTNSTAYGYVAQLRDFMEKFFRANAKFPDFIEIGTQVFFDVYDWHVKNRQQLTVTRGTDGRYWMQFMFTTLLLRGEVDPKYIGPPYDKV